jgi:hypothetical protein
MIYFAREADECYASVGLKGNRMGYFASRSAAFGPVGPETVIATFYNFCPTLVRAAIPAAWSLASPADVLAARLDAVDRALTRGLGADVVASPEMAEAAGLVREAAEAAAGDLAGRPLFAAHAGLPWPTAAHLVLWHAQSLLREYRGDGHIAALVVAGLDPVEALITHGASGQIAATALRMTRAWPDTDWEAGVDRLVARGLAARDEDATVSLTDTGRALRQGVEDQTDRLSVKAYQALGEERCDRLRKLARPWSQAIVAAGMLMPDPSRFAN